MADPSLLIENLDRQLQADYAPVGHLDLAFEDYTARVVSNERQVLEKLKRYYAPFVRAADLPHETIAIWHGRPPKIDTPFTPSKRFDPAKKIKEEYVDTVDGRIIRKTRTGMMFFVSRSIAAAVGDCIANSNQVVNFINGRYMRWRLRDGDILLHAAGVACENLGIAIAGFSGTGKSTLALHLVDRGWRYVSNDRLVLGGEVSALRLYGLPKQPRVNPGTLLGIPTLTPILATEARQRAERLSQEELRHLEHKHDVDILETYGPGRWDLVARLAAVFVLNWSPDGGPTRIEPVDLNDRSELLDCLMKDAGLFGTLPGEQAHSAQNPRAYQRVLRPYPCYEVRGGIDFAAIADEICRRYDCCDNTRAFCG